MLGTSRVSAENARKMNAQLQSARGPGTLAEKGVKSRPEAAARRHQHNVNSDHVISYLFPTKISEGLASRLALFSAL
jgi:hypothetical protein